MFYAARVAKGVPTFSGVVGFNSVEAVYIFKIFRRRRRMLLYAVQCSARCAGADVAVVC